MTIQRRTLRHVVPGSAVAARPRRQAAALGQTLVEFALTIVIFMTVVGGLIDGMRVIFYYSQIQEAAREGARWGSVQVARATGTDSNGNAITPWGNFSTPGNAPGIYCVNPSSVSNCPAYNPLNGDYPLLTSRTYIGTNGPVPTIVGATVMAATAVDLTQATISISSTVSNLGANETVQVSPYLTNQSVSVTVKYPFQPILGLVFGGVTIWLQGNSTMLHE